MSLPIAKAIPDEESGDEYDSDMDEQDMKESLDTLLAKIKTRGSFATAVQYSTLPLPGLDIKGIGLVGLPLDQHTAQSIINGCHKAPYGKGNVERGISVRTQADGTIGSETIVNESVRKTWELNPDRFDFRNPKWEPTVQKMAQSAARELGIPGKASVNAELYKLLLYERAMFKAHQE